MIYIEVCKIQAKREVAYIYELSASGGQCVVESTCTNNKARPAKPLEQE